MESSEFEKARDFLLLHRTDYSHAYNHFRWPRLEYFNWALDYFDSMADNNSNPALWIVDENGREEKYSFAEMSARSNQVANYLRKLGLHRGERIFVILGNDLATWEVFLAAMKLGAIIVPASPLLSGGEIEERLNASQVKMIIADNTSSESISNISPQIEKILVGVQLAGWRTYADAVKESTDFIAEGKTRGSDSLLLYFTSGTSAKPKLVEHTYLSYPLGHLSTMYWLGLQPGDLHFNVSAPGWAKHAWSSLFAPWNAEATVFVFKQERFSPEGVLKAMEKYKVTTFCAPPTVWRLFIQEKLANYKMSLREVAAAGEPLNPEVIEQVHKAWKLIVRDGYGQTETTAQIGNPPGLKNKPGSMGLPLPGFVIRLLNHEGNVDKEGEICIDIEEGPVGLMDGYRGDQQKSAEVMGTKFYHTGDIASQDEDGYFHFIGRVDDVFKSSDYRISPFELENVLLQHEAVAEAAVIPSPDAIRLNVPKAVITLAAGFAESPQLAKEILEFTRQRLSPYKRIRIVEFGPLPKTSSGKIRRSELAKREEELRLKHQQPDLEFIEDDQKYLSEENWSQELP